jgi:uncharacterized protein (TIGR02145 family)
VKNIAKISGLIFILLIQHLIINSCEKNNTSQLAYGILIDIDDNMYKTITIGTQTWTAENLETTKFNDGTDIQLVIDNTKWSNLITPGYCWYNNDKVTHKKVYGALYNWYTVNTGKICPTGWHVPVKDEWMTLMAYINDNGGKLKERGTTHWVYPNTGATNESGFTALPGGFRYRDGVYYSIRQAGFWWSASECSECDEFPEWNFIDAWNISLGASSYGYGNQHDNMLWGYSIRCIKN